MARKRCKNLTQEQVMKIKELKEQGVSSAEIAKIMGCGKSTVNGKLKELGVAPTVKGSKLTGEQITKIRVLSEKNYGSKEIAAIVGCCTDTVNRIQKDRGFKKKERLLTQDQINKILNLTTERYTQDEIAKRVGVHVSTVRRYQQLNELPASNRSDCSGKHIRFNYIMNEIKKEDKEMLKDGMAPRNSGRYSWPEETEKTTENVISLNEKKEENAMNNAAVKPEYTKIMEADIVITGNITGFDYSIDLFSKVMKIDAGSVDSVKIPFKNISDFANEVRDVADKIELIRNSIMVG